VHLTVNCFFLLAFGPIVARRWGASLFLIFFAVCGVSAALAYLAFNWASPVPVIGASGAISGLMPAALRLLPGQAPWAAHSDAPLAPLFSRPVLVFTAFFAVINVLTGLTGWGIGGESGLVAWQAHLGGFLAGLLLCGLFDRLRPRNVGAPVDR
jgi:membrane associated rhomboid family serine protease